MWKIDNPRVARATAQRTAVGAPTARTLRQHLLKNIDPLLSPELLKVLCEMGHGDEIVLADANFTAESLGRGKPTLRLPGAGMRFAFYERAP